MSKYINHYINRLVLNYAKFDKLSNCYALKMSDIPDFDLQELTALLLTNSASSASEATGPDNALFNKTMLPALIKLLAHQNRESEITFVEAWRDGVTHYFDKEIEKLLSDKLDEYNAEHGYTNVGNETYSNYIFC